MKLFAVILFTFLNTIDLSYQWTYDRESEWGGTCTTGYSQSPINIITKNVVIDKRGIHIRSPLAFRGYENVQVTGENNGHTLKWTRVPGTPPPVLSGGPLRGEYEFLQFHLHWLSEHAINGIKYPLEIHMVHIKSGLTLNEALARPDGITVIGALCQVRSGDDSNFVMDQLMPSIPGLVNITSPKTPPMFLDINRFLGPNPQAFYTYVGSLTTPDCNEVVTWIVKDSLLTVSDTQYKTISSINVGGLNNYRSLQPLSSRVVYRSVASCADLIAPNFIGTFAGLLSCLSTTLTAGIKKGICALYNMKKRIFGDIVKDCSVTS